LLLLILACAPSASAEGEMNDYQKAIQLFQEDRYDEAIEVLKRILKTEPNQAPIYNLLGLIYLRQGESVQSAIGSFEQAIRNDPNYAEAYFNLASTYAGPANRPELAADNFKKTLEADPNYTKAHFGLGWFTLTEKQDPVTAAEHFKKAIEAFPDFDEAYYGLGLAYVQMGKAPMALETVSKLRDIGREDLAAYLEGAMRGESLDGKFDAETEGAYEEYPPGPPQEIDAGSGALPPSNDFLLLDSEQK
jgi:tetratricopeptide (TPR) repeat protein